LTCLSPDREFKEKGLSKAMPFIVYKLRYIVVAYPPKAAREAGLQSESNEVGRVPLNH
jgi:hypothetical protein